MNRNVISTIKFGKNLNADAACGIQNGLVRRFPPVAGVEDQRVLASPPGALLRPQKVTRVTASLCLSKIWKSLL